MVYKIEIIPSAQKQLQALPKEAQAAIVKGIDRLATTPRPVGCKKLRGTNFWRIRIGDHRVIYEIDDKIRLVAVLKVARRSEDTYRGL